MKARILKISVLVFAMLLILVMASSPYFARNYILKNGKKWIGRDISLSKIHINYFTSTIRVIDFKMYELSDTSIFTSFDTLLIDIEPLQLLQSKIVVEQLYLKGLFISVIQKDSSFNFDDLIAYHKTKSDTIQTTKETSYQFEISNIELKNGNAIFEDATVGKQLRTKSIDLVIPYLAFNESERSDGGVKFGFNQGGYFEANFNLQPVTGEYTAAVSISKLYLEPFYDFLLRYLYIGSIEGYINGTLNLSGNINDAGKSVATGEISVHDFEVTNVEKIKLVSLTKLNVILHEADIFNGRYAFDSVNVKEPYVLLEMMDSTFNFSNVLVSQDSAQHEKELTTPTDSVNTSSEIVYSLNSFIVDNGAIAFVDHRANEPFTYNLSTLAMNVDSISSNAELVTLYASMLLNERGTLNAELDFNPKNPLDLSLHYVITDFQLSDLNIYSRHYMGFPILYGDMYYKANTVIDKGQLTSENNLIIQNVELGNKRGGLYDLPIKFALFLLKDKDGVIKLDVPVRGDLKDPKIKVGKIIWNTFKNLIIKTAAAPGKMLANMLNVDPKDIESIEFNYADTVLTENHKHQIDLLVELEKRKQGLKIEMIYFNDRQLEKEEIAVTFMKDSFKQAGGNPNSEQDFDAYVRTNYANDSIQLEKACYQLMDKVRLDSLVTAFENARVQHLKALVKSKSDSTQIVVSVGTLKSPKNSGSKPVFEMKFSIDERILSESDSTRME